MLNFIRNNLNGFWIKCKKCLFFFCTQNLTIIADHSLYCIMSDFSFEDYFCKNG